MKRIAVLGSNGQLGQTLQSLVKEDSNQFIFYTKRDINIAIMADIEAKFLHQDFDYCINCAAYTNVESAEKNSKAAYLVNAEGVRNLAKVCADNSIKLIHISTDYVFDGKKSNPYKTTDKTNPVNEYGKSKLKGEFYIKEFLKEYYIIRSSWLYSVYGKNFLKTIINKIKEGQNLKITTREEGTPTSCIDLSEFIIAIIHKQKIPYGVYNFTAIGSTTWYGFAVEIAKYFGAREKNSILPTESFKTIAKRPKYSVLDISKTENVYRKFKKWEDSVETVVNKIKMTNPE